MGREFAQMMSDFGRFGWCGSVVDGHPLHVTDFIPDKAVVSADQFVTWLFMAEGVDPNYGGPKKKLIRIFRKHMGADVVDARRLKWV